MNSSIIKKCLLDIRSSYIKLASNYCTGNSAEAQYKLSCYNTYIKAINKCIALVEEKEKQHGKEI